uniref:Uncharacterized protein n=1 Tax=Arundo donax TaxID=35708 RepID=A0A0A9CZ09_ARUDO
MYSVMGMDHFNHFENGIWMEELQLYQENNNPKPSNGNADTGIMVRRRNATASASNISPSARKVKLQVGVKRMVTSDSESINRTIKFADNSSHLDLMTNVEHRKKHDADGATVAKANEGHHNRGYFQGIKNAFRCSSAGFNILFAVCMIGVATVVLHEHYRPVISL